MAQTTSLKPSPVNVETTLDDIAKAESTYDVMALAAQMLAKIAANSGTSAGHLQTLATFGDEQHPIHVKLHDASLTIIENLFVKHVDTINQRLDVVENNYSGLIASGASGATGSSGASGSSSSSTATGSTGSTGGGGTTTAAARSVRPAGHRH